METRIDNYTKAARKCAALAVMALFMLAAPGAVSARQSTGVYAAADLLPEGVTEGVPASGAYGTATFERTAEGGTRVTVVMLRLEPNTVHVNHIHDGSCTGAILLPLEPLQAGSDGAATATTELAQEVDIGRWFVSVHAGDTLPSPGIACGRANPALGGGAVPPPGGGVVPPAGVPTTSEPTAELPGVPRTGGTDSPAANWPVLLIIAVTAIGLRLRRGPEAGS